MRGRKKIPHAVRAKREEERTTCIERGLPISPRKLGRLARAEWDRLAPALLAIGVLTPLDGDALATYCETLERYQAAKAKVEKEGMTLPTSQGMSAHPLLAEIKTCLRVMREFQSDYGMRAASRRKLAVKTAPEKEVDAFEAFLASKEEAAA